MGMVILKEKARRKYQIIVSIDPQEEESCAL
jgi:hypothetical protein